MVYKTKGVCAQEIQFEMDADEVISRLEGIKCGFKNTSCPDQLTIAIKQALNK